MTDTVPNALPTYLPDEGILRRKSEHEAKKPAVTVDKPIRFRVSNRPGTMRHHYPKKAKNRPKRTIKQIWY